MLNWAYTAKHVPSVCIALMEGVHVLNMGRVILVVAAISDVVVSWHEWLVGLCLCVVQVYNEC